MGHVPNASKSLISSASLHIRYAVLVCHGTDCSMQAASCIREQSAEGLQQLAGSFTGTPPTRHFRRNFEGTFSTSMIVLMLSQRQTTCCHRGAATDVDQGLCAQCMQQ